MAELAALRAKLKDRQVKEGALGTVEVEICLDLELLADLASLESERETMLDNRVGDPHSLAGQAIPTDTVLDEKIEAKKQEIRDNSISVKFRSLASGKYEAIVNSFEDPDKEDQKEFFDSLTSACFVDASCDGEATDLTWDEIQPNMSFGELDETRTKVFVLNRRRQDIPFSLKPSGRTR
jgi:hypothetical protein